MLGACPSNGMRFRLNGVGAKSMCEKGYIANCFIHKVELLEKGEENLFTFC
jgi:hypothetical protein